MSIPSRSALSDITYAAGNVTNRPATKAYQPMAPSSTGLPYMGASTGAPEVLSMPPSSLSMSAKKEPAIHVPSYAKRIINMMYMTERSTAIVQSHLSVCQVEVTDKMRAILVDWLVDVHLKYKCRPETLYLAINLLDRFLMRMPVEKKKLQLVGCVAMMLACKYEEIAPPEVRDFVHISANTYTRPEVLQMERTVLIELDYNLTVPTMWPFLMNLLRFEQSETINHGAEYLAEQTLVCGNMTAFLPSLQAAACVYLARRVLGTEPAWTPDFEEASKYFEIDLQEPAAVLDEYVKKVPKLRISAVRKKFSHSRYSCISRAFDVQGFRPQQ